MQIAPRPSPRRLAGRAAVALAAASLVAAAAPAARAAVYTWTGQRGSGGWGDSSLAIGGGTATLTTNWGVSNSTYIFPPSSASTSLFFGPTSGPMALTNDLANPFVLNALTFTSNASAYTIGGNTLAFTADGGAAPSLLSNATVAQTLDTSLLVNNNLSVAVTSTGGLTLAGRLTGAGGVYKAGTGTLVLSGGTASSPTSVPFLHLNQGPALISGGTLNLTSGGSTDAGGESSVTVDGTGSYLTINNGAHASAAGSPQIDRDGVLVVDGAGTTLDVSSAGPTPADVRVGITGGTSYFQANNGAAITVGGDLHLGTPDGRGILALVGGGTVAVSGALVIDGAADSLVSVSDGALTVGALASVGPSAPRIFLTNPSVGGGAALTVGASGADSLFAGQIHGSGTLQKVGAGTLTLTSQSDYTGGTNLVAGTLRLAAADALSPAGRVAFPAGGSATLDLDNHNLTVASLLALADDDTITLGGGTLTVTGSSGQSVFAGVIQDGPHGSGGRVVKTGIGSLNLAGTNTYTGGTTIAAGAAIVVSRDANLGAPTAPLTLDNGYLLAVGSFSTARPVTVNAGESFIDTAGAHDVTLTGSLAGAGVLTAEGGGAGTVTLAGATGTLAGLSTYNPYPGRFVLDHATLSLTSVGSTGFGGRSSLFVDQGSSITIRNGTTLTTTGNPQLHNTAAVTVDGPDTVWNNVKTPDGFFSDLRVGFAGGTSRLNVQNGATVTTNNLTIGNAYLTQNPGVGAVTVSSGSRLTADNLVFLSNGSSLTVDRASATLGLLYDDISTGVAGPASTVTLTDPAAAPGTALVIDNRTSYLSATFTGPVTDGPNGPGGVTFSGPGRSQYLTNASYSGPTVVNSGTLGIINNTHTGAFTANNDALLFLSHATLNPGPESLTANGASFIYYDTVSVNGGFFRGAGTHVFQASTPSVVAGSTFLPGSRVTNGANLTFANVTSGAAITNLAPLTWDGGYNTAAGTLNVHADVSTDFFENDGAITVYNTATLSNSQSNLVSGGGSSITVYPGGAIHLNSTSLELHAATLVNNGTIAGGPTAVYANSTAKGSGTFGPVSLLSGGTFSPGNSPGPVTTGSATWSAGGTYLFELARATGTPGVDWDLWTINGDLTLAATHADPFFLDISPFNLPDFDPAASYDWLLATVTGSVTNFDPDSIVLRPDGVCLCDGTYSLTQSNGDIVLHYNPVPEPATLSLLALGTLPLLTRRRRRRARQN